MNSFHTQAKTPRRRQLGLTLIEVMVAIVIALILLAVTISVFIGNKRSYSEQEELSRMQENARYALDLLTQDIRMANYGGGCVNDKTKINFHTTDGTLPAAVLQPSNVAASILNRTPLEGFVSPGSAAGTQWYPSGDALPPAVANNPAIASDGILTRYTKPGIPLLVATSLTSATDDLVVEVRSAAQLIHQNDVVTLTNCVDSEIFKVTNAPAAPASYPQPPSAAATITLQHAGGGGNIAISSPTCNAASNAFCSFDYQTHSAVVFKNNGNSGGYVEARYYIGDEDCNSATADTGARNLCRDNSGTTLVGGAGIGVPVAEGIEYMRILYGEDTAGNDKIPESYKSADAVGNWANVTSVKIAILARTPDAYGVDIDHKSYQLLDQCVGCTLNGMNDRYRRRVFTTTIYIPNQSFLPF